jgi:hypothetical protein
MSMAVHPGSFVIGLVAAWIAPSVARVIRPLAVEAAVVGMALVDEGRRVVAEQMEGLEDLAAEARARRDDMLGATNGHHASEMPSDNGSEEVPSPTTARRASSGGRRRAS